MAMTIEEIKKVLREQPELIEILPDYKSLARALISVGKTTTRVGAKSPHSKSHRD